MAFDEERARQLERAYARRDFQRRRDLVQSALGARAGERVLDVGCGPGFYVEELSDRVGSAGEVVGVDISGDMLALAHRRCAARSNVALHEAPATSLPVDDSSFDAAVCVQVLEFVEDVDAALSELRRALRSGGRVVAWDVDWSTVSWYSAATERMARVLNAWDRHLSHPSLPRTLAPRLRAAGFGSITVAGHAFVATDEFRESYGASIMPAIARYVAGRDGISEREADDWVTEQRELGEAGGFFFACLQFCFTAIKA